LTGNLGYRRPFVPDKDETLEYKNLVFEIKDIVESKIDKILKPK
jgi:hypothetical protein